MMRRRLSSRRKAPTWRAMASGGVLLLLGVLLAACSGPLASAQTSEPTATADNAAQAEQSSEPTATADDAATTEQSSEPVAGLEGAAEPAWLSPATRTSEGGQVTVAVTWQSSTDGLLFKVVMDTHSVDLDRYDLRPVAVLRTDEGMEVQPSGWDAPRGGHHRGGTLLFPSTTADGTPLIGPGTRAIELVIRDVAGVPERVFQWTR